MLAQNRFLKEIIYHLFQIKKKSYIILFEIRSDNERTSVKIILPVIFYYYRDDFVAIDRVLEQSLIATRVYKTRVKI